MTLPVLWLYGTAGVGKTTAAWALFEQLPAPVGLVDIDQIGMCYGPPTSARPAPEPVDDPGRHSRKARNLDAVAANFRAVGTAGNHRLKAANLASLWQTYAGAGARRCVIVGPVTGPDVGVYRAALPAATFTVCRLRATPATLAARVQARGRGESPAAGLAGDLLAGASPATLDRAAATAARDAADQERAATGDFALDTDRRAPADLAADILCRLPPNG